MHSEVFWNFAHEGILQVRFSPEKPDPRLRLSVRLVVVRLRLEMLVEARLR